MNIFLLIPIYLLSSAIVIAEEAGGSSTPLDSLERTLELDRHEQLLQVKSAADSVLTEFTTDGCSGGLSLGWSYLAEHITSIQTIHGTHPPWEACCVEHDRHYHSAGSRGSGAEKSFEMRKEADTELRLCVLQIGIGRGPELSSAYNLSAGEVGLLYTVIAKIMYRAVRLGGMPCSGLPWRWGYGWPECE